MLRDCFLFRSRDSTLQQKQPVVARYVRIYLWLNGHIIMELCTRTYIYTRTRADHTHTYTRVQHAHTHARTQIQTEQVDQTHLFINAERMWLHMMFYRLKVKKGGIPWAKVMDASKAPCVELLIIVEGLGGGGGGGSSVLVFPLLLKLIPSTEIQSLWWLGHSTR